MSQTSKFPLCSGCKEWALCMMQDRKGTASLWDARSIRAEDIPTSYS